MSCVNIKNPEFKAQAKRLNISVGHLRNIVHEFMNQEGNENSFPDDSYVESKLQSEPNVVSSDAQIQLWKRKYAQPLVVTSRREVEAYKADASRFFNPRAVKVKELPNGNFEVSVGVPVKKNEEGNTFIFKATPLKDEYRGKLIYAQSGTGKTSIADNINVIDGDILLAEAMGVTPEVAYFAYTQLDLNQRRAVIKSYRQKIAKELQQGNTVLTSMDSMLNSANVIIYNESPEETTRRTSSEDRAGTNRYSNTDKHTSTYQKIEKALQGGTKEAIKLTSGEYLSDKLLTDPTFRQDKHNTEATELEEATGAFLDSFGISVKTLEDYEGDTPLFDTLHRVINIRKAGDITNGMGYAIAFMMQHDPSVEKVIVKELLNSYIPGLDKAFSDSTIDAIIRNDRSKTITIPIGLAKILGRKHVSPAEIYAHLPNKQRALKNLGNDIASELRKYYNREAPSTFVKRIWDIISNFFERIMRPSSYREKMDLIHVLTDGIIRKDATVVRGAMFKPGTTEKATLLNVEQAFRDNPYEAKIIGKLSEAGFALAGSTAIRTEGTIYRPDSNPLHDLDFSADSNSTRESIEEKLTTLFPNIEHVRTIRDRNNPVNSTETYLVMDKAYELKRTVPGIAIETIYDKKTGEKLGTMNLGMQELQLEDGVEGKLLDFFVGENPNKLGTHTYAIDGKEYLFTNADNAFSSKVTWQRRKDMWDYRNYVPVKKVQTSATENLSKSSREEYENSLKEIVDKAPRNSEGNLLAPNGKESNLTERQYAQVRTSQFKEWFGDWENDPENSSKVVDENGEPLVVYHNTDKEFSKFSKTRAVLGSVFKGNYLGTGFYFSTYKGDTLGKINMPVFLNIKSPASSSETFSKVNDGIEFTLGAHASWYVAKNANQIKSATENNGEFSPVDKDINHGTQTLADAAVEKKAQIVFERRSDVERLQEEYNRKSADYKKTLSTKLTEIRKDIKEARARLKAVTRTLTSYDAASEYNKIIENIKDYIYPLNTFQKYSTDENQSASIRLDRVPIKVKSEEELEAIVSAPIKRELASLHSRLLEAQNKLAQAENISLQDVERSISDFSIYHGTQTKETISEEVKQKTSDVGVKLDNDYRASILEHLKTDNISYEGLEREQLVKLTEALFAYFDKEGFKINVVNRPYTKDEAEARSSAVVTNGKYATVYYVKQDNQESPFLTLVHELLHVATSNAAAFEHSGPEENSELAIQLNDYYYAFVRHINSDPNYRKYSTAILNAKTYDELRAIPAKYVIWDHAASSTREFLSCFLNEKDVREEVKGITYKGLRGLYDRVSDAIMKFLERIFKGFNSIQSTEVLKDITDFLLNYKYESHYDEEFAEEIKKDAEEKEQAFSKAINYSDLHKKETQEKGVASEVSEPEHVTKIREIDESISDNGFEELIRLSKEQGFTRDQLMDYATEELGLYDEEYKDIAAVAEDRENFEALLEKYYGDNTSLSDKTADSGEETQEGKGKDEVYYKQSTDLVSQLRELRNSDKALISQSEVRHLAEQCVYWISDRISDYLSDPQKLLDNFGDQLGIANKSEEEINDLKDRIKSMSRVEVVNLIGAENIISLCKESLFVPSSDANGTDGHNPYISDDFDLIDKAQVVYDNFNAIMKIASDVFTSVERFSIVASDKGTYEVNTDVNIDNDNFNESQETEDVKENEGSEQEHWQIESRTIDVLGSMSQLVRQGLTQCYLLEDTGEVNEDGSPKYEPKLSEFGVKERVNAKDATNQILRWTQGAVTYEDMISKLQGKVKENPWVSQLIDKLVIKQGEANPNADFQSQFFGVFNKHFQPYSIVIKEDGKYKTIQVNEHPALRDAVSSVTTLYKIGEHPMFTQSGVNKEQFSKFSEAVNSLQSLLVTEDSRKKATLAEVDRDKVAENIWFAAQCLGYYVAPEMVSQTLTTDKALNQMADALGYIKDSVSKELDNKAYNPFKFDRTNNPNGISGNLRSFLRPLTDILEDVAVSSFYDSGKMYQSYVTPSYMTKLMGKFGTEGEEFTSFIQQEYGDYEWFKDPNATDVERGWKNEWLRILANMSSEERKKLFKHKVQLNFNKHNYMRNMSDTEYTLSLITEFFSETKADKTGLIPAWYRIPMLSNKPSSEFIQFYRYHGDFTEGNMSIAKQSLVDGFKKIFDQELSRIKTCRMRAEQITDKEAFIKSFDTNGKKFMFLDFMNNYLLNPESKDYNSELANLVEQKLDTKKEADFELSSEDESKLNEGVKKIIADVMDARATQIVEKWKSQGIFDGTKSISNLVTNTENADAEVENNLREFVWNDAFAAMNIMQLTVTDIAYYKDAEDLQKRLAQIHAPGIRGNASATDYEGHSVTDGIERTFYLTDFDKVKSNIIENVSIVFDRKLKALEGKPEYTATKALYTSIVNQFREINVADAQGYSSPTSYRKKAFVFGQWSPAAEETYQNLLKGNLNFKELQTAFQPLKPFVYSQITKPSNAVGAPMQSLKVGVQNKNSEYLLIMADAILQGQDTGRPNLLRAIYRVMEDSAKDNNLKGIDTVQFESTVKAGLMGRINLKDCMEMGIKEGEEVAYSRMMATIGNSRDGYNSTYVHEIPFEDYCMQQPVPEHFKDHEQAHGSQIRYIIASDLEEFNYAGEPVTYDFYDPRTGVEKKLSAEEFKKEYEETIAENIQESINDLSEELGINDPNIPVKSRNIALSRILQREILSSPRYGIDLLEACSVNEEGEFNIPLGDPIQSKRVEQLINSIIKNRINKQKIAGGPVVQVTNFGTSKELNIRFKDREGNLLKTRKEFEGTDAEFKDYISKNQAGIAYFEVFAPIYANELFERFVDKDGNVDIEAIERVNPDLLKMIGYRIPTEDKYSMAPLKIVGFLPREAGEGIMMPNDITLLTGSDFDVDKMYLMRKEYPKGIHRRNRRAFDKRLFAEVSESYKRAHNGKANSKYIGEQVRMFLDNPERMKTADPLMAYMYKIYQRIAFDTDMSTEGRAYRNNKIIDMSWAVLTNETTADKMLNPGGFEEQKVTGYMVEAQRLNPEVPWDRLEALAKGQMELKNGELGEIVPYNQSDIENKLATTGTEALKSLCYTQKNLSFIDTHIQFYKQNSAASTILGMFAVQKVAHAVLESNGYYVDVNQVCHLPSTVAKDKDGNTIYDEKTGNPVYDTLGFTIAGMTFKGRMELDNKYNREGQLIGKTLGSLVASAADAVKDPVLNLMNINSQTANVLNTLIRLGMPFNDAALFLSQKAITDALNDYNSENITTFSTLTKVMEKKIAELEKDNGFGDKDNKIHTEELTKEELTEGIYSDDPRIQYKVLKAFTYANALARSIKGITFATRLNSISSAVGPLIIDNLIMEHKMDSFSDDNSSIYDGADIETSNIVDMDAVLSKHPILEGFSETAGIASTLFKSMPANSIGFRNVLGKLGKFGEGLVETVYGDRKLLSQLSDFYQAYMLVANDAINKILEQEGIDTKYGTLDYFINKFPADFMKGTRDASKGVLEKYKDNALVQAIKLDATKEGRAVLKVDITGLDTQQKEKLSSAWIDLHKDNPRLSTMLFLYNYYRTGVAFSPKTFMSLVPAYVKEQLAPYMDTYRKFPLTNAENVIDQFVRNNWDNNKLVPRVSYKDIHFSTREDGTREVTKPEEVTEYQNSSYLKMNTGKGDILLHQVIKSDKTLVYEQIEPLGHNGEYLEISKDAITSAMEKSSTAKEQSEGTEISEPSNSEVTAEPLDSEPLKQSQEELTEELITLFQTTKYPTKEEAKQKIAQYKQKSIEDKKALESQMKAWLKGRLDTLGLKADIEKIDELYKLMC